MTESRIKNDSQLEISKKEQVVLVFDIGLAILRSMLSFSVLMTHCFNFNYLSGIWKIIIFRLRKLEFHVPIFFIMSFYFSYKTIVSSDFKKKILRLQRLFIPYCIWPTIYFFYYNNYLIKYNNRRKAYTYDVLKTQLLCGNGLPRMGIFWSQWTMIIFNIFFNLIIFINNFILKRYFIIIFIALCFTAVIYQYNGTNLHRFRCNNQNIPSYVFCAAMMPYAVIGFIFSHFGIIKSMKKIRIIIIFFCIYFIYLISNYKVFNNIKGFYFGSYLIFSGITVFILFSMFPSEIITNKQIINIIKIITKNTAGIYFLHSAIKDIFSHYIIYIRKRTLKGCIIIYLICYLISLIGSYVLGKTKLRHLFE